MDQITHVDTGSCVTHVLTDVHYWRWQSSDAKTDWCTLLMLAKLWRLDQPTHVDAGRCNERTNRYIIYTGKSVTHGTTDTHCRRLLSSDARNDRQTAVAGKAVTDELTDVHYWCWQLWCTEQLTHWHWQGGNARNYWHALLTLAKRWSTHGWRWQSADVWTNWRTLLTLAKQWCTDRPTYISDAGKALMHVQTDLHCWRWQTHHAWINRHIFYAGKAMKHGLTDAHYWHRQSGDAQMDQWTLFILAKLWLTDQPTHIVDA